MTRRYQNLLERITPSLTETNKISNIIELMKSTFGNHVNNSYPNSFLRETGSVGTNTFLRGFSDIDLYFVHEGEIDYDSFSNKMKNLPLDLKDIHVTKNVGSLKVKFEEKGTDVQISPISNPSQNIITLREDAFYHNDFINSRKKDGFRENTLLAKEFFRVSGLYSKIKGVSIEILMLEFQKFEHLLEEISSGRNIHLDFSGKYEGNSNSPIRVVYPHTGLELLNMDITNDDFLRLQELSYLVLKDENKFSALSHEMRNLTFWKNRAEKTHNSEKYSMPDVTLQRKEFNELIEIVKSLGNSKRVLDLGCGTGIDLIKLGDIFDCNYFLGIDNCSYAIEEAIEKTKGKYNLEFRLNSATTLDLKNENFDLIYMKRVLSNIAPENQLNLVSQLRDSLNDNGNLLIFDYFREPYDKLDGFREKVGLDKLKRPNHNDMLSVDFTSEVEALGFQYKEINFSSSYFLMTRVILPKLFGNIGYDTNLHQLASIIPNFGNFGVDRAYLFKKS